MIHKPLSDVKVFFKVIFFKVSVEQGHILQGLS